MLTNLRGVSPLSETMSEGTLERNRAEKALITKTPTHSLGYLNKPNLNGVNNYSDKNGNEVLKSSQGGRKTFAFWTLVFLLFLLAVGNLVLTFIILSVLRLGQGMESMEFLPEHNAIKFFGKTDLEHIYKRDGQLESFQDSPMMISSENGSVLVNLQTRFSRTETKLAVNKSGVFIRGAPSLDVSDPSTGQTLFSTAGNTINMPEGVNVLQARMIQTKRITSPIDESLSIRTDTTAHLRGAEGTHIDSKELNLSADQDIYLKSINGSVILSGKDGVFIDVKLLPIALPVNKTDPKVYSHATGQFKLCVCMPQGKLFRVPVINGQKVSCAHINVTGDLNPCA